MKKLFALLTKEKGKMTMNEWENDDSVILRSLYSAYLKKLGLILFPCLLVNLYMRTNPLIKLQNLRKSKKHIARHCTPNGIYTCILSHTC